MPSAQKTKLRAEQAASAEFLSRTGDCPNLRMKNQVARSCLARATAAKAHFTDC